jgi:hypothetical protein
LECRKIRLNGFAIDTHFAKVRSKAAPKGVPSMPGDRLVQLKHEGIDIKAVIQDLLKKRQQADTQ